MDYRLLGRTGVKVAPLCLGTDNFANPTPEAEAIKMLHRALDAGINLIDTSNSYSNGESERIIGRALAADGRRQQAIVATKFHYPTGPGPNDQGNSRLHLLKACEDSLRRLQTDYIDLYQLHRPSFDIPVDETLGALTDLVRQGKVRYIGSSTAPAWKVMEALMVSELRGYVRFVSEQPPYNLLDRRIENELIPLCQAHGLAVLPWSPLAHGMLAGRYDDAATYPADSRAKLRGGIYAERINARGVEAGKAFVKLAQASNLSAAQLAVLWVKDQPGITAPLIGARTLEQLEHFLPVLEMRLTETQRKACDELVAPGSAVANFHNSAAWMKMRLG
jgi:aryl-alcohol dehydrogenase-like predicted oxidoreductase